MEVYRPRNLNDDLLAYSPLAGEALTGKYTDPDCIAAENKRFNPFPGYKLLGV